MMMMIRMDELFEASMSMMLSYEMTTRPVLPCLIVEDYMRKKRSF